MQMVDCDEALTFIGQLLTLGNQLGQQLTVE